MKSNYLVKKLLVLVLALVLLVSLVACGDKTAGSGETPAPAEKICPFCKQVIGDNEAAHSKCEICGKALCLDVHSSCKTAVTAKKFFNNMWEAAASIGAEDVDVTKDLAVELGLRVEVFTGSNAARTATLPIDVDVKIFVDSDDGKQTAANVALSLSELSFELYYFLDTPTKLYVEAGATSDTNKLQYIEIELNDGDNTINGLFAAIVDEFLTETKLFNKEDDTKVQTILDIVETMSADFGEADYSLDSSIFGLLGAFGLGNDDLTALINGLGASVTKVLGQLGIGPDKTGKWSLKGILESVATTLKLSGAKTITKEGEDPEYYLAFGGATWNGLVPGLLSGLIKDVPAVAGLLDNGFELGLGYTVNKADAEDITSFYILAQLFGDKDVVATGLESPFGVKIIIDKLSIANTGDETAKDVFGIDASDATSFKASIAAEMVIPANFIKLKPFVFYDEAEDGDWYLVDDTTQEYSQTAPANPGAKYKRIASEAKYGDLTFDLDSLPALDGTYKLKFNITSLVLTKDGLNIAANAELECGDGSKIAATYTSNPTIPGTIAFTVSGDDNTPVAGSIAGALYRYAAIAVCGINGFSTDNINALTGTLTAGEDGADATIVASKIVSNAFSVSVTNLDIYALINKALTDADAYEKLGGVVAPATAEEGPSLKFNITNILNRVLPLFAQYGDGEGLKLEVDNVKELVEAMFPYDEDDDTALNIFDLIAETDSGYQAVIDGSSTVDGTANTLEGLLDQGATIIFAETGLTIKLESGFSLKLNFRAGETEVPLEK